MTKINAAFMRWWVIVLAIAVLVFWGVYAGVPSLIWEGDVTKITFATFFLGLLTSLHIGWNTARLDHLNFRNVERSAEFGWFGAESCIYLALVGTAIGFIYMMTTQFAGVTVGDHNAMVKLISSMTGAMGTALYTTAAGVGTALLVRFQAFNLEKEIERIKAEETEW